MAVSVYTGTVSLTNGSPTIVVSGFTLSPFSTFPGAQVSIDGEAYFLESVTNTTTAELTRPYTGATASGLPLEINTISDEMTTIVSLNIRTADLIEDLLEFDPLGNLDSISDLQGNGVIMQDATGAHSLVPKADLVVGVAVNARVETLAERDAFDAQPEGFSVYVNDIGDGRAAVYFKLSNTVADWSTPAYQTGPVGPVGPVADVSVGTTTTGAPGTNANVVGTPTVDGIELDFIIPAGEGFVSRGAYSGATAYVKGDVVLDNSSSWIAKVATTGNAPPVLPTTSNTQWQLLAAKGTDGASTGDVVGPASAVADRIAVFDGTSGKLLKDGGSTIAALVPADGSITNAKLANVRTATVKGRTAAGTGIPTDLTMAQLTAALRASGNYDRANILGTVSQDAGVPTGAIIERGSNANGEYVRFADGTQICINSSITTQDVNNANGSLFISSTTASWTFPSAFSSAPTVSGANAGSAVGLRWVGVGSVSSSAVVLRTIAPSQSATALAIGAVAIGVY